MARKEHLQDYNLMLEDQTRMRFVKVQAENPVDALLEAIKKSGILNPLKVLRIGTSGTPETLVF